MFKLPWFYDLLLDLLFGFQFAFTWTKPSPMSCTFAWGKITMSNAQGQNCANMQHTHNNPHGWMSFAVHQIDFFSLSLFWEGRESFLSCKIWAINQDKSKTFLYLMKAAFFVFTVCSLEFVSGLDTMLLIPLNGLGCQEKSIAFYRFFLLLFCVLPFHRKKKD